MSRRRPAPPSYHPVTLPDLARQRRRALGTGVAPAGRRGSCVPEPVDNAVGRPAAGLTIGLRRDGGHVDAWLQQPPPAVTVGRRYIVGGRPRRRRGAWAPRPPRSPGRGARGRPQPRDRPHQGRSTRERGRAQPAVDPGARRAMETEVEGELTVATVDVTESRDTQGLVVLTCHGCGATLGRAPAAAWSVGEAKDLSVQVLQGELTMGDVRREEPRRSRRPATSTKARRSTEGIRDDFGHDDRRAASPMVDDEDVAAAVERCGDEHHETSAGVVPITRTMTDVPAASRSGFRA